MSVHFVAPHDTAPHDAVVRDGAPDATAQDGAPETPNAALVDGISRADRIRALAWQLAWKFGGAALVLWAAVTVAFLAIHFAPGDTASMLLGQDNRNDPVLRAQAIERWGLDQPLVLQYLSYFAGIFHGDLGESYVLRKPVTEVLGEQLLPTIQLALTATVLAFAIAFVSALVTSGRGGALRSLWRGGELVLVSLPPFWFGIVLLAVFSFNLGWFPVSGAGSISALVLPAIAMAVPTGAYLGQVFRESTERSLEAPYTLTARSRGVGEWKVRTHHSLRHGSLPVVTLTGLTVGGMLGGAVITEKVFGRPGIGQVAVAAVTDKDIPVILGVAILATTAFVVATTIADLILFALDPRLRESAPAKGGTR
ncbi:MAG: ABC transporter permease [Ancrocorticia sp.]|uniref:ABC transporter permease n=1 Tax=Ancrocorticia sp. TaxID=2593684 RepID=UPI003F8F245F